MTDRDIRDLKVLLVEDVEDTRLFMRLVLEEHGFIVLEPWLKELINGLLI